MMCDLSKITQTTRNLFYRLDRKLKGTDDEYRYVLGVNGLNEVCFTDLRTMTDVKGNRAAQAEIKKLLKK